MNEKEKKAIEYLKTRLHGNEGCKYIDVSQEDLRIFINLVDRKEKDIEGWKKYCEEIEEEQTEMSNKNCELEFEIEKLQKENEELKNRCRNLDKEAQGYFEGLAGDDTLFTRTIKQLQEENKTLKDKYAVFTKMSCEVIANSIPVQKVKDKIEELNQEDREWTEELSEPDSNFKIIDRNLKRIKNQIEILQELLEGRK